MAPEIGSGELLQREQSPIQKREQRVHSYMMRFNEASKDDVGVELNRLIAKGSDFSSAQNKLANEIHSVLDDRQLVVGDRVIKEYGEKLESRREAEDAMVALLYDIQTPLHGRNMHVSPTELPKLLKILEDTRERKATGYILDELMASPKDQAILFLTQTYFYGTERINGKKVVYIEDISSDEIEIEKLVPKFNMFLPEKDRLVLVHRKPNIPGVTYFSPDDFSPLLEPKKQEIKPPVKEKKDPPSPIKTAAEKKRAEEVEGVLSWIRSRLDFDLNKPENPISTDIDLILNEDYFRRERGSLGEIFGSEGKENVLLFSLLSATAPKAGERIVGWLIGEKRATKRKEKIQEIVDLSKHLFQEVLSSETNKKYDVAFADDIILGEEDLPKLHSAILKLIPQGLKKDGGVGEMEQLVVEAAERLFLLKQAHILGDEIKMEILAQRKAILGGTPIDAEGESTTKDIEEVLKKIEAQIGHPVDQNTSIKPYEINVNFPPLPSLISHTPYDPTQTIMAKMMNGEMVDERLFRQEKHTLCGFVLSLGIEKWSHQARTLEALRQKMPPSEVEKAGHYMPYKIEEIQYENGHSEKVQTYYIHDNTPDPNDPNKGCLFVDSQTHLSIPVVFETPTREGENMRIEYVYGLNGNIQGIKEKEADA